MFDWFQNQGSDSPGLDELHRSFLEMLQDGRHIFDAASNALLGGTDPEVIREDLYTTDQRINHTERKIRRALVVHGSVHGRSTFSALLVMMSVAKDAERVGDYAKNLFELARIQADLGTDAERAGMVDAKTKISKLLARAHGIFEQQDKDASGVFLEDCMAVQRTCDTAVKKLVVETERNTAGQVLCWRYMKRVASHVGNIVTSVVVSVDQLDFYPGRPESES
ncbi:MAG: phosphate transport system protein [Planctomycetota bacterium]|jgi:phosphate transport system protein